MLWYVKSIGTEKNECSLCNLTSEERAHPIPYETTPVCTIPALEVANNGPPLSPWQSPAFVTSPHTWKSERTSGYLVWHVLIGTKKVPNFFKTLLACPPSLVTPNPITVMGVPAVEGKLVSLLSAIGVTVLAADSFKTATSLNKSYPSKSMTQEEEKWRELDVI